MKQSSVWSRAEHPFLPEGWFASSTDRAAPLIAGRLDRVLPDLNPAALVVARMAAKFRGLDGENGADGRNGRGLNGDDGAGGVPFGLMGGGVLPQIASLFNLLKANGITWQSTDAGTTITSQLSTLNTRVCGVLGALNGASGTATCHGDGTITITLTLPGLPAACP